MDGKTEVEWHALKQSIGPVCLLWGLLVKYPQHIPSAQRELLNEEKIVIKKKIKQKSEP
jgi:hypothetical protein